MGSILEMFTSSIGQEISRLDDSDDHVDGLRIRLSELRPPT
jgi:hypothetical protein